MANKSKAKKTTSTGRAKPVVAKAGFTKNPKRRYGCGGKLK
jgi:hypothetical protein